MTPERVLAVGAHPDDCEFYAGATLAALVREGARVVIVICTDGARSLGGGEDLPARRRAEAEKAAAELGVAEVVSLGHPDGDLRDDDVLIGELVREIRRVRPLLVLGHDPATHWTRSGDRYHLGHTDHRAAGRAVLAALYPRAANASFFAEQVAAGLSPWWVPELWLFDTTEPDEHRDVEATLAAKRAALARHETQDPGGALVRAADVQAERTRARLGFAAEPLRRLPLAP
jgi:LmbE family N-acetylglucosaminyl deacetylase